MKRVKLDTTEFINRAKIIHGNRYDYSKVNYVNSKTKVCIICREHGEFYQTPDNHINVKNGCPKCAGVIKSTTEEFVNNARLIHEDKYDYSKVEYINAKTKVCIICPEHGEFYQTPNAHTSTQKQGCPKCNKKSVLENMVKEELDKLSIKYIEQYKPSFLKNGKGWQSLDFYLPECNIAIECQGKQHYGYGGWSKKFDFDEQLERDRRKHELCEHNGIKIIYFSKMKTENSISDLSSLIKLINSYF